MTEESLRAHVERLRSELAAAQDLDPETREELQRLAQALEATLEHPSGPAGFAATLRERLADRLRELEVSHPRLSSTLGNLVDTLAFYGI